MASRLRHTEELQELASLIFATRRLMRQRLAAAFGPADPSTWLHMETLFFLHKHTGASMRAVALHLSITIPSASALVSKLVRAGFVKRSSGKDKRMARLSTTARGARELARALRIATETLRELFGDLRPEELHELLRILRRATRAA